MRYWHDPEINTNILVVLSVATSFIVLTAWLFSLYSPLTYLLFGIISLTENYALSCLWFPCCGVAVFALVGVLPVFSAYEHLPIKTQFCFAGVVVGSASVSILLALGLFLFLPYISLAIDTRLGYQYILIFLIFCFLIISVGVGFITSKILAQPSFLKGTRFW